MKIKELIAELQKYDPEMEVFLYNGMDEGDAPVCAVQEVGTAFYCKGDSAVEDYLYENRGKRVLVLHDDYYFASTDKDIYYELDFPREGELI